MASKTKNPVPRSSAGNRATNSISITAFDNTRLLRGQIDFAAINAAALASLDAVLNRLLPNGKTIGREFHALNPRWADRNLGSFKINRYSCRLADFATVAKGADPISLTAYLADVSQAGAARLLARMLGLEIDGGHHG
jgi:hypothetical protein